MEIKGGIRVSLQLDWRGSGERTRGCVIYPANLCLKMVCGDTKTLWRYHGEEPLNPELNSWANLISQLFELVA